MRTYRVTADKALDKHTNPAQLLNAPQIDENGRYYWKAENLKKARDIIAVLRMVGHTGLASISHPADVALFNYGSKLLYGEA